MAKRYKLTIEVAELDEATGESGAMETHTWLGSQVAWDDTGESTQIRLDSERGHVVVVADWVWGGAS